MPRCASAHGNPASSATGRVKPTHRGPSSLSDVHLRRVGKLRGGLEVPGIKEFSGPSRRRLDRDIREPRMDVRHLQIQI